MTAIVRTYTRGRGFVVDPADPNEAPRVAADLAAIIVTATARLLTNPPGVREATATGVASTYFNEFGFNLAEQMMLNSHRRLPASSPEPSAGPRSAGRAAVRVPGRRRASATPLPTDGSPPADPNPASWQWPAGCSSATPAPPPANVPPPRRDDSTWATSDTGQDR